MSSEAIKRVLAAHDVKTFDYSGKLLAWNEQIDTANGARCGYWVEVTGWCRSALFEWLGY